MDVLPQEKGNIVAFSMSFTFGVMFWNDLEQSARKLLIALAGDGLGAFAAITHLGNTSLTDALLAVSAHLGAPDIEDAIKHFVKCKTRLRAYRNYYVHGADTLGSRKTSEGGLEFVCYLSSWSARGKVIEHADAVSVDQMEDFGGQCGNVAFYGNMILTHLEAHISGKERSPEMFPLENKPPLPEELKKTPYPWAS